MIQRIQTLYLAIGAIALSVAYFLPLLTFIDNNQIYLEVYIKGLVDSSSPSLGISENILIGLQIVVIAVIVMSVLCIFLYKNRKSQLKLVRFLVGLLLVAIALMFFQLGSAITKATGIEEDFNHPAVYLMLVSLVMYVLAFRGIRKDEALVRAADRLR